MARPLTRKRRTTSASPALLALSCHDCRRCHMPPGLTSTPLYDWGTSVPRSAFLVLDQITSISTTSNSFDSLFRVLFIFPSQYLFAIGFPSLFSLRWSIPPILSCTLKQLDSFTPSCLCCPATRYTPRESHPLCCRFPSDLVYPSPSIRRGL